MSTAQAPARPAKFMTDVDGLTMAYLDTSPTEGRQNAGAGGTVILLHGNPTSSYLWRHVIAELRGHARCVAPDLVGMGDSDKLPDSGPGSYTFVEHRRYLDGLLDHVVPDGDVTLVVHDWGSALGFDWARRHPNRVRGIAYLEAIVQPLTWDHFGDIAALFQALRSPAGEQMVLGDNAFVEGILPGGVLEPLSQEDMAEYQRPFLRPGEDRRPTLTWPRQIPIEEDPGDVTQIVREYGAWLSRSDIPKLFINADPGAILTGKARDFCRSWPSQRELTVPGRHYLPEDSGTEIGRAVAHWMRGHD